MTTWQPLSRAQWIQLLHAALDAQALDFLRQAAHAYLVHHPHDLVVRRYLAQAEWLAGEAQTALQTVQALCLADPEDLAAQTLRLHILVTLGQDDEAAHAAACVVALSPEPPTDLPVSPAAWGEPLREAYRRLAQDPAQAEPLLLQVLPANPPTPLPAVVHLHWAYRADQWPGLIQLARTYHQRWPDTLVIRLYLAHALNQAGQEDKAVALLHALVGQDPGAQVIRRTLGSEHPYLNLWPEDLTAPLDLAVPASVAGRLGWNLLPGEVSPLQAKSAPNIIQSAEETEEAAPSPAATEPLPEEVPAGELEETEEEGDEALSSEEALPSAERPSADHILRDLAQRLRRPELIQTEGRFPVYVLLTSYQGLRQQYGPETAKTILKWARRVVRAVAQRPDWDARLLIADDPRTCAALGIRPVSPEDAWALKRQLADLDAQLAHKGEMIGALFILGGPEVIPFHHLPNPVGDGDRDVPSDNPYGARDENFYAPEWPVGRLPGGANDDPTVILAYLRRVLAYHRRLHHRPPWYRRLWLWLRERFGTKKVRNCRGYAAAVWASAARMVFRAIGSPKALVTSPPHHAGHLPPWNETHLAYFNLHGLADAPAWYGQRAGTDGSSELDYPVALRPEDFPHRLPSPRIVLSEACYGAHLDGRTAGEAIALRLLETGTMSFVGSTVTAYGAVEPPLGGADLLAWHFWHEVRRGLPIGEALRRAKFAFAREMYRRQHFLDGEDLKTLLSFVLYGDPLIQEKHLIRLPKAVLRPMRPLQMKAVADLPLEPEQADLPPKVAKRVREVVATYLPGMADAEAVVATEAPLTPGRTPRLHAKGNPPARRRVVLLRKTIPVGGIQHVHYARVILDEHGKVKKLSLSR